MGKSRIITKIRSDQHAEHPICKNQNVEELIEYLIKDYMKDSVRVFSLNFWGLQKVFEIKAIIQINVIF